jgi:hypothetical protein
VDGGCCARNFPHLNVGTQGPDMIYLFSPAKPAELAASPSYPFAKRPSMDLAQRVHPPLNSWDLLQLRKQAGKEREKRRYEEQKTRYS